jgi:hypothetical protein
MHHDAPRPARLGALAAGSARAARRTLVPLALVVAVLICASPRVSAGIAWCKTDPIVAVGDESVNIYVSAPETILGAATGPTDVVVYVPVGSATEVLFTDPGFGYGETVTIVESNRLRAGGNGTQIIVAVTVPASASLPVLVEIVPQSAGVVTASASGSTNGTVRIWTTV